MIGSKCNESGLENTSSGFPICDKQQPIAAKKTALRDSQNDNRAAVPKPLADPSFVNDRGRTVDIKVSGTKRPTPEGPTSPLRHQSPSSNGVNAQFVYIRRKSEQEPVKSSTSDNTNKSVDGPHLRQISHVEQETSRQQTQPTQVQGLKVSTFPAHAPMPMTSLVTFSSGAPSVPNSLGKPVNVLPAAGTNHPTVSSEVLPVTVNNPQGKSERTVNVLSAAGTNHPTVSSEIIPVTVNNPQGKSERTLNVSVAGTNPPTVSSEIIPVTINNPNPQGKSERTLNVSVAGTNHPTVSSEIIPVTVNNPQGKSERTVNVLSVAGTNHPTVSSEIPPVTVNNPQGNSERTVNVLSAAGTNHPRVSSEIPLVTVNNPPGKTERTVNVLSVAGTNHPTVSSEIPPVTVNNPQGKSERTVNVLSAAGTNHPRVSSEIPLVTVNNPPGKSERTVNVLSAAGTNHPRVSSEILPVTVNNPQGRNERNWKERFSHLQAFLRNCDQSSQEEYIEMLTNMSPVGRSKHAVELEKRAIHLLLEEGKEIQRMNILNVLGKPLLKNNNSPSSPQVQLGK